MPLFLHGAQKLITGEIDWLNNVFCAVLINKKDLLAYAKKEVDDENLRILGTAGEGGIGLKDFEDWDCVGEKILKFSLGKTFVRNTRLISSGVGFIERRNQLFEMLYGQETERADLFACSDTLSFKGLLPGTFDTLIIFEEQTKSLIYEKNDVPGPVVITDQITFDLHLEHYFRLPRLSEERRASIGLGIRGSDLPLIPPNGEGTSMEWGIGREERLDDYNLTMNARCPDCLLPYTRSVVEATFRLSAPNEWTCPNCNKYFKHQNRYQILKAAV